jgi:hypothetical protein
MTIASVSVMMMITITTPRGVTIGSGFRMMRDGATEAMSIQRETMGDCSISIQRSTHGDRTGSSLGNISDIASCQLG